MCRFCTFRYNPHPTATQPKVFTAKPREGIIVNEGIEFDGPVFHGTDDRSAGSIMAKGLDRNEWLKAAGGAGVDPKGFSVTTEKEIAEAWARARAAERGGKPVVLESPAKGLPLHKGDMTDLADPDEFFIRPDDFPKVGPGSFRPTWRGCTTMPYLLVNLYQHHPAESFDPDSVVDTLREAFPDIEVKHGDQLTVRARQAEKVLSAGSEADQAVLAKLKRDASEQGPARAFVLTLEGQEIQGVVKRQLLQMTYETPLSDGARRKIKSVIRSLLPLGEKLVIEELP